MTEKRFVNKGKDIFQYGEWWCSANGEHCADVIATAMNELSEKNKQLKKQLDEAIDGLHKQITSSENAFEGLMNENKELRDACKNYDWYKLYNRLRNENEQLKKALVELKEIGDYQYGRIKELSDENEKLKQQLAHHTRMHEWFRNEAYLLQNKLDNREDEIRRLKGDVE